MDVILYQRRLVFKWKQCENIKGPKEDFRSNKILAAFLFLQNLVIKLFFFVAFYFIMTNYINRCEKNNKLDEESWLKTVRSLHI